MLRGAAHAPLLYAADPRSDLPEALQARVAEAIRNCDPGIVAGWLRGGEPLAADRQPHGERAAFAHLARQSDSPPVALDDLMADRES